ncbi:L-2-haloalkanoic acid dehalogenase, HAD superfamily protein [Psychromonas ingrahamii 37]|uniref:(S)-2-haloacid dehalogenase n=1 Tax=Psychromonas ingrahamii (strain DSM 17664 / CCUG 51855 / 37) TaxID=357804 RepID=A1SYP0_PSYIN|nr:haloacid dehalogenase type II [Psychromonas ingrahamii]ABM04605.1 L-2-haloalkanoic acid dehalogenase, HAD superfamily protein [Psychromonas ingrahamii 37]
MSVILAFDVYGTLINTHGIVTILEKWLGKNAQAFSQTWRDKQLEYSFRRGLMQNYQSFAVCTRHALDYTCNFYRVSLSKEQKQALMDGYKTLPAFDDAANALAQLKGAGFKLYAFSNGTKEAVEELLTGAGIRAFFDGIVSCDDLKSFKPNPAVYCHFLRESGAKHNQAWLISSNPFDVIGAISTGMLSAWVQRSQDAIFDPWDVDPTAIITSLKELKGVLPKPD